MSIYAISVTLLLGWVFVTSLIDAVVEQGFLRAVAITTVLATLWVLFNIDFWLRVAP